MTTSWAQRAAAAAAAPVPPPVPTTIVAAGGGGTTGTTTRTAASMPSADAPQSPTSSFDPRPYVVLDTNALLLSGNGGAGLSRYAMIRGKAGGGGKGEGGDGAEAVADDAPALATLVTTKAALAEVRDAASREALQRLRGTGVCELTLREPDDEDVKAVLAFARETGELHSLSSTDARLIAVARGLERAAGRARLLRSSPPPPRAVRKGGPSARPPPGWGATGGLWAPLDALEEEEERAARAAIGGGGGCDGSGAEAEAGDAAAPPTPAQKETADTSDESSDDEEGGGWSTAAGSHAAQRRQKRSAARRAAREAAAAAAAAAEEDDERGLEAASDDDDGASTSSATADDDGGAEGEQDPAADSPISLVTADFAMQNVALQMGLRVLCPSGSTPNHGGGGCLRVERARRWALRCSACSRVCREPGRLFCPSCGNSTLEKVEVVVDFATGCATYGVRKSRSLRGTKFSLPKPRGGRGGSGPILREDQLLEAMARAKRRGSSSGRKKGGDGGDDPLLAPELATADAWFKATSSSGVAGGGRSATAALGGATAALVAATWKHNPNEARRWGGGVRAAGSAGKRK